MLKSRRFMSQAFRYNFLDCFTNDLVEAHPNFENSSFNSSLCSHYATDYQEIFSIYTLYAQFDKGHTIFFASKIIQTLFYSLKALYSP